MNGRFITFEGPEGVGKSTQIKLLRDKLCSAGHSVVLTREPGGTQLGESVRDILQHTESSEPIQDRAELLLFAACRAQLVETIIRPALHTGKVVLCDRFYDSTMAYQGYGRMLDRGMINRLKDMTVSGIEPDLTILMDLPVDLGLQRARERAKDGSLDRIERESIEFHQRVGDGYRQIADQHPERIIVINAQDDLEENSMKIWNTVHERLF